MPIRNGNMSGMRDWNVETKTRRGTACSEFTMAFRTLRSSVSVVEFVQIVMYERGARYSGYKTV